MGVISAPHYARHLGFVARIWPGDSIACAGKIRRRYEKGGKSFIEAALSAENRQDEKAPKKGNHTGLPLQFFIRDHSFRIEKSSGLVSYTLLKSLLVNLLDILNRKDPWGTRKETLFLVRLCCPPGDPGFIRNIQLL